MASVKIKENEMAIRLHTHLKRMVNKACTMGWSVEQVHKSIDEILNKYGVGNKLPVKDCSKELKEKIMIAFRETGRMDLYDGDLITYLTIITFTLQEQKRRLNKIRNIIKQLSI